MEDSYKVSICIPIYNAGLYLERCVRSLFEQTYENLEYLFVDDCSSDNSINLLNNVIDEYPSRKDAVKIIRHETNKGVCTARNTLLTSLSGDFFTFVDADDYIPHTAVELLVSKQMETNADLVSGDILIESKDDNAYLEEPSYESAYEMLKYIVSQQGHHENWGRLYRSDTIRKNNLFYTPGINIGEDWLFLVKYVLHTSKIASIHQVVYYYNKQNTQSVMHDLMSSENLQKWYLADLIVLSEIKNIVSNSVQMDFSSHEETVLKIGDDGLREAASNSDKKTFCSIKKIVLPYLKSRTNTDVGKYNRYSICGIPNYYLCMLYERAIRIKYRIT